MCHLQEESFEFYYETFSRDGSITEEGEDYKAVKRSFINRFGNRQEPEDSIRSATIATLNNADLVRSLQSMDTMFEKAGFNDAVKFGLLRQALMFYLAKFAIYRGSLTYYDLRRAFKEYDMNRSAFFTSGHLSKMHLVRPSKSSTDSKPIEEKVENLAE